LDKKIPGIGATTLELKSERNSIVIVPTKSLAYSKYKQKDDPTAQLYGMNAIYVGSAIGNDCPRLTDDNIKDFVKNSDPNKKIIVVADSLGRVLNTIGKRNYDNYFLMVDEVDIIQSDSTFRPHLEDVIDYYLEFKSENRCLVSATIKELPHPLLQPEIIVTTQYKIAPARNILLINTDNPHIILKEKIIELDNGRNEKIVVAYNSIDYIKNVIALLPSNIRHECAIFCSESSKADTQCIDCTTGEEINYYSELVNGLLDKRITFMTCAYFVGIDILDRFHLISVANPKKLYTLLSIEKIIQIKGRCRHQDSVFSDTIIYSTIERNNFNFDEYKKNLEDKANGILELYKVAKKISKRTPQIAHFFDKLCDDICSAGQEKIEGDNSVSLTRKSVTTGEYQPSYFNIDSLVEKMRLMNDYYSNPEQLKLKLQEQKNWTVTYIENENRTVTGEQRAAESNVSESNTAIALREINDLTESLRSIVNTHLGSASHYILQLKKGKTNKTKAFLDAFAELYKYVNIDVLIQDLKKKFDDNRKLKTYKNAVKFWALDSNHPFKEDIFSSFGLSNIYTRDDIHTKLTEIFRNNHLPIPTSERKSIEYLSVFFELYNRRVNNAERKIIKRYNGSIDENTIQLKTIPIRTELNTIFEFD
jgi:hypothetical protein